MAAPNITGTFTGAVLEDSGAVITGALTETANGFANTWAINSGASFGSVSINAAGVWSYDLDDTNATVDALGAGATLIDTFVVRVTDALGSDTQVITITITGVPCFTAGTLIETAEGPRDCADLVEGDLIWTRDGGLQPVRWIGRRRVEVAEMAGNEKLCPVRIAAGALGAGVPERDLLVSRQHRMVVSSDLAQQVCGAGEVLLPAIRLVGLPGIVIDTDVGAVDYIHLLFDSHQIVFAEGAPSESLLLGAEALRMLPQAAREEIETLFPKAAQREALAVPARMIPERRWQKALVAQSLSVALLQSGWRRGVRRQMQRQRVEAGQNGPNGWPCARPKGTPPSGTQISKAF
ncbi:Hint domain-containing protein [Pseudorhodobacter ferrugineus]|uniref:Hint domain-containing protein n=1 Tax=Pseudorhodobacter ferrugineus TaxID=77008 RepID=UPI0003B6A12A|nr:Hint domain-containing protein [Pseudorhodobacter ferrugineus]